MAKKKSVKKTAAAPAKKAAPKKMAAKAVPASGTDDNVIGMLAHLLTFVIGIIAPIVMYFVTKEKGGKAFENSKHSLNFQISLIIYAIIAGVLVLVLVGFVLLPLLGLFDLIFVIIASVKAYKGEVYKYPLEIQFFK